MDLPSNPETTPGMDGKGRLDLDRFLFRDTFLSYFQQKCSIISKKHKSPKIKYLVDDIFSNNKNYQINSPPFGTSHPPKAGGLISDATYVVAKSVKGLGENGHEFCFGTQTEVFIPNFPDFLLFKQS